MALKLDTALGIHPQMLQYRTQRMQILANNMANSDTPNYKAQDLTFLSSFEMVNNSRELTVSPEAKYRIPHQRSLTGNTVELSVEQAKFAETTANYQFSLNFLKMKISGLKSAIEGR
ncbi:flagellar basal body protein [Psychromonas sp. Urea-02u-13]|uniref:flagellar basal body protein n=1 Tax=Psychromonas sp. Urea-02u-13 TaxID=2058326 RepID=UPI000C3216AD|nr:flagellar basal body protein [Psychromonas sp. Urea-02u-13]PKG39527.1 flagellar basal body rod protein FlgB [Psychromonas sp. Urea-02u-13]